MKWIGQHIWDFISRFRNDVYLEDISTGTIATGGNLGLDSSNKIVKANQGLVDDDITLVDATHTDIARGKLEWKTSQETPRSFVKSGATYASNNLEFGTGNAVLGMILHANQGLSIGGSFANTIAPNNGAIIEGRVGIGTNSPSGSLHIYNTSTTSDGDGSAGMLCTGQDSILLYGNHGTEGQTYGSITWTVPDASNDPPWRRRAMITGVAEHAYDQDYTGLAFYTQGTDGEGDFFESMRISHAGNVGIGTDDPSYKLQVEGQARFNEEGVLADDKYTSFVYATGNNQGTGGDASGSVFRVHATHASSTIPTVTIRNDGTGDLLQLLNDGNADVNKRFVVQAGGNVGIGTNNPSVPLHVSYDSESANDALIIEDTDASSGSITPSIRFKSSSAAIGSVRAHEDRGLQLGSGTNKENLTISSSGNVGIGTITPTTNFQVAQVTSGIGTVTITSNTTCTGTGTQFQNTFKVDDSIIITATSQTRVITNIASQTVMTIVSATNTAGSAYTLAGRDLFSVAGNGNVGIGTTNPDEKLTVGDGSNDSTINIDKGADHNGTLLFNSGGASSAYIKHTTYEDLDIASGAGPLQFLTGISNETRMVIEALGNVGIGMDDPDEKLEVDGTVKATGFAGPLTGDVTGNTDTATALATARAINGVDFDGSADITITAAGSTLSDTVPVSRGGTGQTSFGDKSVIVTQDSGADTLSAKSMTSNGSLLIGGSSGPEVSTLTQGSNITITNDNGAITIAADNDDVSTANLKTALATGFDSNAVSIGDSDDTVTIPGALTVTGSLTAKQREIYFNNFEDKIGTSKVYIPLISALEQTSPALEESCFLAPTDGRIVSVTVRPHIISAGSDCTVTIEVSTMGLNTSSGGSWAVQESKEHTMQGADDYHAFHYVFDEAKHFESGELVALSIQSDTNIDSGPYTMYWYLSTVIEYDWNNQGLTSHAEYDSAQ